MFEPFELNVEFDEGYFDVDANLTSHYLVYLLAPEEQMIKLIFN